MNRNALAHGLHAGSLFAVLGVVAWATGQPFVFPSLGPSAYVLATRPNAETSATRRVVGGHVLGVVAGFAAYHALAAGSVATQPPPPLSVGGLRLAASGTVAVAATTVGMLVTDARHAPACATTLIVALGLLSSVPEAVTVVVGVVILAGTQLAVSRLSSPRRSAFRVLR